MLKHVEAGVLRVAYEEYGPQDGAPVVLLHGFPYDVRVYDEVVPLLMGAGCRVLVPYLRGYGPTRFLSDDTPRSGQQAALAHDLLALLNALSIDRALLAGYDWGGRAACIVAALWGERTQGLVTGGGYNIQDIARAMMPETPERELALLLHDVFDCSFGEIAAALGLSETACRRLGRARPRARGASTRLYQRTAGSTRAVFGPR